MSLEGEEAVSMSLVKRFTGHVAFAEGEEVVSMSLVDDKRKQLREWREFCTPSTMELKRVLIRGQCPPRGHSFMRRENWHYDVSQDLVNVSDECYWCGFLDCPDTMYLYCNMCKAVACEDEECHDRLNNYDRVRCVGMMVSSCYCPRLYDNHIPFHAWIEGDKIPMCSYPQCIPCAFTLLDLRRYSDPSDDYERECYRQCRAKQKTFCRRCAVNYLCYNDCVWDAELEMLTCANAKCRNVELKIRDIIKERAMQDAEDLSFSTIIHVILAKRGVEI